MSLFACQLAATLYMTGVIWMVQLVQYPMIDRFTGGDHEAYTRRMGWVVGPAMLVELVAQALWLWRVPSPAAWSGAGLLAVIWISTAGVQVPQHHRLSEGYDPKTHRALVRGNWIRVAAWSARSLLLLNEI
jgi:hypothetical protein